MRAADWSSCRPTVRRCSFSGLGDGRCRQVLHVGHDAGAIAAPPTIAGDLLLLADNDKLRGSTLRAFAIDAVKEDSRLPVLRPVQEVRLEGHVDLPPLVDGKTVLATTDSGAMYVFELDMANPGDLASPDDKASPGRQPGDSGSGPLHPRAYARGSPEDGGQGLVRFALLRDGRCWIAGAELAAYEIRLADDRLLQEWTSPQDGVCLQPLRAIGRTICQVRRREGVPGIVVSAVAADQPEVYWQTWLAAPLAGEPVVDAAGGKVAAVTAAGAVFRLTAGDLAKHGTLDQPLARCSAQDGASPAVQRVIRLSDTMLALTGGPGSDYVAIVDLAISARGGQSHFRRGK